jgi:hypothetical protein
MTPVLAPNLQNRLGALAQAVGADIKALNGKVLSGANLTLDTFHSVGAVGEPPFQNGWSAQPGYIVRFRKDPFGKVSLSGVLKPGSTGVAFTLPAGYAPAGKDRAFTGTGSTTTPPTIDVLTTGEVYVNAQGNSYVYIDVVEFDNEAITQVLAGPQGPKGDMGGNATVPMDTWHSVGNSGEPAFTNGWVNYGGYPALQFRKDPFGKVQLRGAVKNGTLGTSIFTLPLGYRPPAGVILSFMSYTSATTFAAFQVTYDGTVSCYYRNDFCDAAVIEFDTDTVTSAMVGPPGPQGVKGDPGQNLDMSAIVSVFGPSIPIGARAWTALPIPTDPTYLSITSAGGSPDFTRNADGSLTINRTGYYDMDISAMVVNGPSGDNLNMNLQVNSKVGSTPAANENVIAGTNATHGLSDDNFQTISSHVTLQFAAGTRLMPYIWISAAYSIRIASFSVVRTGAGPQGPQGPQGVPGNSITVPMDTWHIVGNAGEPAYTNLWLPNNFGYEVPAFRKDPLGRVHLRGTIRAGTINTNVFTLPVGYRPPFGLRFPQLSSALSGVTAADWGQINVQADGTVTAYGTNNAVISLDGISFDTASVTEMPTGPQGPKGDPGGNATVAMDTWHSIGTSGQPAFSSGWVNYGSTLATAAFRKDPMGKVQMRGRVMNGTAGLICTLPVGYRPSSLVQFTAPSNGAAGQIIGVAPDGTVVSSFVAGAGTSNWITLDVIEFDTDSVSLFAVGPQGPKGDAGGLAGVLRDLDGLNYTPQTFRSRLMFPNTNFHISDGGPSDGFGGGDFTKIDYGPTPTTVSPPTANVQDGTEFDVTVAPGVVWRMRMMSGRMVMVGGSPLTYSMQGENSAYAGFGSGQTFCVNASSKLLQWQLTPLVDVWVEVEFFMGLVQKMDAAYSYIQISPQISPAPPITAFSQTATRTQHAQVNQFEPYFVKARWGLTGGVAYAISCGGGISGGSWTYYQAANTISMQGKAWPR